MADPRHSEFSRYSHEMIVEKMRELVEIHGEEVVSIKGLQKIGLDGLRSRIKSMTTYRRIKEDLGFQVPIQCKSIEEAESRILQHKKVHGSQVFNSTWLRENDSPLSNFIFKTKGLLQKLRSKHAEEIGAGLERFPRGYFEDESKLLQTIEEYIRQKENQDFTISELQENIAHSIGSAIRQYGGIKAIKEALKIKSSVVPSDITTWEQLVAHIKKFIEKYGKDKLSTSFFHKTEFKYLTQAINNFGGIAVIRERLDLPSSYVDRGYWNQRENVIKECLQFIEEHGAQSLTQAELTRAGKKGLVHAITKHGGMESIRKELRITEGFKKRTQWTAEKVLTECKNIIQIHGEKALTRQWCDENGRSDIYNAIRKYYGTLFEVRKELGISVDPYNQVSSDKMRQHNLIRIKALIKSLKLEIDAHGCSGLSVPMMIAILRQGLDLSAKPTFGSLNLDKGEDLIKGLETNELTPDSLIAWAYSDDEEPTFSDPNDVQTFEPVPIDLVNTPATDSTISVEDEEHLGDEDEVETFDLLQPLDPNNQFKVLEALTILADDPETLEFLKGDAKRELWALAYTGDAGLNKVIEACQNFEATKPWTAEVKSEMLKSLEFIQSLELPKEYNYRVNGRLVKPHLMQWAVAANVLQGCQTLLVMSDMGTGKSLAAQLAVILNGSKNVLVIAKNECTQQWVNDFSTQWNGLSVHQITLNQIHQGVPSTRQENGRHVYVMPSHYFSMMSDEEVLALANAISFDAVILDEIHVFKSREEGESNRKRQVTSFLSQVQSNNPERIVLGLSGTVIVNSMDEGRSLLELVTCQERPDLNQGKGLEKAQRLHQALMANGIRQKAAHVEIPIQFNRPSIDASHFTDEVKEIIKLPPRLRPYRLEQLFISSKVPSIVEAIDGPTIIATQYVDGFADVIEQAALKAGYRVGVNTGDRKHPCFGYDNAVEAFKAGAIEVLIGSIETICTGIDGFQNVCSNMIIASMPWTAANYQQLVKRIARHGQSSSKVVITIPRTFIEYFDKADNQWMTWSFCDYRQSIIDTKQRLMDAVIDGYVPPDVASKLTEAEVGKKLGAWLERISEDDGVIEMPHRPLQVPLVFKDTTDELKTRRKYGEFSRINGRWNSSSSQRLHQRLLENPQEWELYHTELEAHRAGWNVDPLQECINYLGQSKGLNIGDFGCGTAQLADALQGVHSVFSFDHVAFTPDVIACDIAEGVPLEDKSLDVAVFSLSLMGSNWKDQLTEARRCLKDVGQVIIWNASSSIDADEIQRALTECGFAVIDSTAHDKWIYIRAAAALPAFAQG